MTDVTQHAAAIAIERGDEQELNELLAAGHDPDALAYQRVNGSPRVMYDEPSLMRFAARRDAGWAIRLLAHHGADPDAGGRQTTGGAKPETASPADTPLGEAARMGALDAIDALIASGADPNLASNSDPGEEFSGETPLIIALLELIYAEHERAATMRQVVLRLLALGADADVTREDGMTPLHFAVSLGDLEITQELLTRGADASAPGRHGWSALHAASLGSIELVPLLIETGANPAGVTTLSHSFAMPAGRFVNVPAGATPADVRRLVENL